jgi:predicted RNase H-like HicB family nuclease
MARIRVIHEQDQGTWVATSPEVPNWTVVDDTYEEAHRLAGEEVRFALDHDGIEVKHFVPAPAA